MSGYMLWPAAIAGIAALIVERCGKPEGASGMIEASTTNRRSVPWTRPDASTTAPSSGRLAQPLTYIGGVVTAVVTAYVLE